MSDSRHILLVEDEPTLQRILGSVLTDAGHAVESVGTAEAAIGRLADPAAAEIDLILSDKNLPGQSGLDLLTKVRGDERAAGRQRGFVLVTGYPSRDSALTVLAEGGDGYLVKPFRSLVHAVDQVQDVLRAGLEQRRAAAHVARRVSGILAGEPGRAEPGLRVVVMLDDADDAARIEGCLSRAGAAIVALDELGDTNPRALVAGRIEDLEKYGVQHPEVGLVLADAGVSFNDVVSLIRTGGGAVCDPAAVPS
jgi:CheY-like chemotaxis protein